MCLNDCVRACSENIQISGGVGIGSCTMAVPLPTQPWVSSSYWLKTKWWLFPTPPTPLTSLLFPPTDEAGFEREAFLLTLQRFNKNCWLPLTAFALKILDIVSSSGNGAGITASSQIGSTWKGTTVENMYKYLTILGIFWVPSPMLKTHTLIFIAYIRSKAASVV